MKQAKWKIQLVRQRDGKRWYYAVLVAANGEFLCWTESYTRKADAKRAVETIVATVKEMSDDGR